MNQNNLLDEWISQLNLAVREILHAPECMTFVGSSVATRYFHDGYSVETAATEIAASIPRECVFERFDIDAPEPQPTPESSWIISGVVESANREAGTITLWLNGWGHFETVPIDPKMPGWLLDIPEVPFRTTIPRRLVSAGKTTLDGVVWGDFFTTPFACMSEFELFESLRKMFGV